MKILFSLPTLVVASFLIFAGSAPAQNRKRPEAVPTSAPFSTTTLHEVVLTPSRISIESYKESKSRTDITLYGAYNRHFKDNFQLGFEGGLVSSPDSKGGTKTLIAGMGVVTYNFETNLRNSLFAQGGLGLYPTYQKDDGDFQSKLAFFAGVGKRWEIWGKLNFMPYLRVWKRGGEDVRFEVQALNFSIFY